MENTLIQIDLNFERKFFEEIYFKNNKGNILFGSQTMEYSISIIILSVILFFTKSNSSLESNNWGLFYFILLLNIALIVILLIKVIPIIKWKKSIKEYLDFISNHQQFQLIATEESLIVALDENKTQERWREIKSYEENGDYISVKGNYEYFIPKKSMTNDEFEKLKIIIGKKVNE